MSRLGGAFWFILVIATGMTNFLVKQTVQGLDDQLTQVKHKTAEDQKKIHDLVADWTFLNQPELLSDLNNRYVHLVAVSPKQIVTNLDSIPMRPAPPPDEASPPVAQVAVPAVAPPPIPMVTVAEATLASAPARMPIMAVPTAAAPRAPAPSLSLISVAHAATVRPAAAPEVAAAAPVRSRPAPAPQAPSLDALFAQVAGDR